MPTTMASIERLRAIANVTSIIKPPNFNNDTSDIPGHRVTNQRMMIPCMGLPGCTKVKKITMIIEIKVMVGQSQDIREGQKRFIVWLLCVYLRTDRFVRQDCDKSDEN